MTRTSYGLSTIRRLRIPRDDFIITSIGRKRGTTYEEEGMKCVSCGSENYPGARFCQTCGQPLMVVAGEGAVGIRPDQIPYQYAQQVETSSGVVSMKTEKFLWRVFGGVSWLMVSIGTFLVASGYLGIIDSANDYYASPMNSLRMIGYGIVAYAIAAIFVALNRFVKSR